jgi:hypothetical protein
MDINNRLISKGLVFLYTIYCSEISISTRSIQIQSITAPIGLAKRKQELEFPFFYRLCYTLLLCLNYVLMLVLISFLMLQVSLHFFVLPFVFPQRFRG